MDFLVLAETEVDPEAESRFAVLVCSELPGRCFLGQKVIHRPDRTFHLRNYFFPTVRFGYSNNYSNNCWRNNDAGLCGRFSFFSKCVDCVDDGTAL